ncbi:MAG TPA: excinuclease ABC subunit C [Bacteroidales bacterium]|nr:excinuclease ABC subunit C [Bacteroidales bacterium]
MQNFYVYILLSEKTNKFYIGSTENIENRQFRHNAGHTISTKTGIPWKLVYFETFETRVQAVARELEIKKKKSRAYIEKLIAR